VKTAFDDRANKTLGDLGTTTSDMTMSAEALPELTLPGLHETLLPRILRLAGIGFETPVLDLGCGSGAWLASLARAGFKNLHGIDNESFVSFPAVRELPISFSHSDLDNDSELGLRGAKFGLITAIEVIEHLHNPGRLLRHVARHLSQDGYFLLTTPNVHSLRARLRFALTGKLAGFDPTNVSFEHTHLYPVFLTCLERLLTSYGLKIDSSWTFPPERGGGTRLLPGLVALVSALILSDEYPGDSLCVLSRHA
jgi:2-polyprenyl-3-methyl-5-hydroxy-6-metoxy-1,4-benzoquinol methylase